MKILIASLMIVPSVVDTHTESEDILRSGREAIFFLLTATYVEKFLSQLPKKYTNESSYTIFVISGLALILALIQFVMLLRRHYFGFPASMFVSNFGTIPDALSLYWTRNRPSGTFGEPSYFGFVICALFLMVAPRVLARRRETLSAFFLVCTGLLTQSISCLVSISVLAYLTVYLRLDLRRRAVLATSAGVFALVLLAVGSESIVARISQASAGRADSSITARTIAPTVVVLPYVIAHPFGVPPTQVFQALDPFTEPYGVAGIEVTHNALLNLFFFHGIVGFVILVYFAVNINIFEVAIFLLLATNFNGSFFTVDKFPILITAIALYLGNIGKGGIIGRGVKPTHSSMEKEPSYEA